MSLPQNPEVERALLCACAFHPDLLDREGIADLEPGAFAAGRHGRLWSLLVRLRSEGAAIDLVILEEHAVREGVYPDAERAIRALEEVAASGGEPGQAAEYAALLRELGRRRDLIAIHREAIRLAEEGLVPSGELIAHTEARLIALQRDAGPGASYYEAGLPALRDQVRRRIAGEFEGMSLGFHALDDLICGVRDGQLVVVGARPGVGKTTFMLNVAENLAFRSARRVLFLSLEMSGAELREKILVSVAEVSAFKVRTGQMLNPQEIDRIDRAAESGYVAESLLIDDCLVRSADSLAAAIRRARINHKVDIAMVDYLQLISPSAGDHGKSRQEVIAEFSRLMKLTARRAGIPIVVASQLNRESVKDKEVRPPRLSDLRESGAIEQDADVVILLHRPSMTDPEANPRCAEAILAKNRSGRTGTAELVWNPSLARYENFCP